ncbi:DUF5406 family protein [Pseudomonas luteola]|uniref:DUF5406 family protein n=1 Tax=Pseudomonas luteola TaxID=47886 RepID=UPI002898A74C|nr:DUF5406 family protein [Pseudomonas luteola]
MNYDPNMTCSGRIAIQTVRLTFGSWEYRATMEVTVNGNCSGFSVIESAVERAYDLLEQRKIYGTDETYAAIEMTAMNGSGDTLDCCDDDLHYEDWLKNMLISAEITAIKPNGHIRDMLIQE